MVSFETILVCVTLIIAAVTDIKSRIIPNKLLISAAVVSLLISGYRGLFVLFMRLAAAIALFIVLYFFIYKNGFLPGGDMKAFVFIMLCLGPRLFVDLVGYMAIPTIMVMLFYLIRKGEISIPYALPMCIASVSLLIWG